jgi:hypothetical protein
MDTSLKFYAAVVVQIDVADGGTMADLTVVVRMMLSKVPMAPCRLVVGGCDAESADFGRPCRISATGFRRSGGRLAGDCAVNPNSRSCAQEDP